MKTRKDVKQFQEWGKDNKVIANMMSNTSKFQPHMYTTGYYSAYSGNWAYEFGIVKIGNKYYELMTQFGGVCGGHEIYMDKYTAKLEREL